MDFKKKNKITHSKNKVWKIALIMFGCCVIAMAILYVIFRVLHVQPSNKCEEYTSDGIETNLIKFCR